MSDRWQEFTVAPDRTHHRIDGSAAYEARFEEVLTFHAPGLAPVRDATGAYHISPPGRAAYAERYLRTFGFYEGRAAVQAHDGWFHIQASGKPLYSERYAWCGNYQGGRCTVRCFEELYFYLLLDGQVAYPERYHYAGDYRDGVAVVQREDGLHTHINLAGQRVHEQWFLDLDVFHKGCARARDDSGWHHIDVSGRPLYSHRFAAIEPFYNGQARVESVDGSLFVIDETGAIIVKLRGSYPALRKEESDSCPEPLPGMR
jgi:hypothetical protein